jgi:CheY-like chemotaxis protein
MLPCVLVRIEGFSAVERHALNTLFRLSQDRSLARGWSYEPWQTDSPSAPRLALIDGASPNASETLAEVEQMGGIGIVWVGAISPAKAWQAFQRPLKWPSVLQALDEYFTPRNDIDVDFGTATWPSALQATGEHFFPEHPPRRALVADADSDSRLYLRTKLASYGIMHIDEAQNVLEAKDYLSPERLERMGYDVVAVDLDLPGGDPWTVLAASGRAHLKLAIQNRMSFSTRMSAKVNRCSAMSKPLHPSRLNELLDKI